MTIAGTLEDLAVVLGTRSVDYGAPAVAFHHRAAPDLVAVTSRAPTSWKRHFRLGSDEDASRALARRLWPACGVLERKKDHGRAEALLMARYGLERLDLDRRFMPEPATTAQEGC